MTTPAFEGVSIATVQVGDKLANGATVLAVRDWRTTGPRQGVVFLALSHREFVTWVGAADGTGTCWGHYFGTDLREALADFQERQ